MIKGKKTINLIALVILISTSVFTPLSFAQLDNFGELRVIPEHSIEIPEDDTGFSENNTEISGNNTENVGEISQDTPENNEQDNALPDSQKDEISENNEIAELTGLEVILDNQDFDESDIIEESLSKEKELITQKTDLETENNSNDSHELSTFEKAFQEVAYAYYMRGPYLHYNVAKGKGHYYSPEETTSQDYNYMACGLYVKNVWKELLGVNLGYSDGYYRQYAQKYIDERPEVIGYGELQTNGDLYWRYGTGIIKPEGCEETNPTKNCIIKQLKIGDIFGYNGHVMLVYDYKYNDESGDVEDVYLIHATAGGYNVRDKIHSQTTVYDHSENSYPLNIGHGPWSNIRYNNFYRKETQSEYGVHADARIEGTISLQTLGDYANNNEKYALLFDTGDNNNEYAQYYYIIRFVTSDREGNSILNINERYEKFQESDGVVSGNDYINHEINYPISVQSRLKYSKLYIEKTVDKEDNNIVEPGDELTYTIKIQNNSNEAYTSDLTVIENIDTNLVEYLGTSRNDVQIDENQLKWNIGMLNSGEEVIIEYTVKVKVGNIGETIESTGMVDNIPSGTVINIIGKNTDKGENLADAYNNLKDSNFTGKKLINEIYKEAYGIDLELDKIVKINTANQSDTGALIYYNNKWGTFSGNWDYTEMWIVKGNTYSKMVLNGYFNVLYKAGSVKAWDGNKDITIPRYTLPAIAVRSNDPDKRADTIFPSNFKTGDILIYKNSNDIKYSWNSKNGKVTPKINTYEDGEYSYIYIDGKFMGVNLGNDKLPETLDDRNEFTDEYYTGDLSLYANWYKDKYKRYAVEITPKLKEWLQYQSLFGKDVYVILRPSLAIRSISYELDGGINNEDNPSAFILGRDVELKEPTKTGYTFNGWYSDSEYTNQVNNTKELTDDIELYAKWEKNSDEEDNPNGGGEQEGSNNYSGGGGHRGSNNSSTNTNIKENQHGSANVNQEKLIENSETPKTVENIISTYNKKNGYTVKQTVASNNPKYSKEFNESYSFAKSNGITSAYSIEKAKMNTNITRIQMAKMLSNYAINVLGMKPDLSKGVIKFTDVTTKMDKQYDNGVSLAYMLGIMGQNMESNKFRPNDEVTRAEFVTALSRMLYGTEDGTGKTKYYEPHMAKLYNEGIITKMNPKIKEKRGYVMLMLMRSVK